MHKKCTKRSTALADAVDLNPAVSTVSEECPVHDDKIVIMPAEQGETSSCELPAFEPVDEDDNDDDNCSVESVVLLPRFVALWPLANLTKVVVNGPWPGHVDEEPTTVTVSHGHALKRGHLDGPYAEVAGRAFTLQQPQQSTSGRVPIVVVLRQVGGQPANGLERLRVPRKMQVPEDLAV